MCILWRQPPQPAGLSLILQAILACCHLALQPARCQNLLEDAVDDEVLAGINRIAMHRCTLRKQLLNMIGKTI
jgi:hypothetical protein